MAKNWFSFKMILHRSSYGMISVVRIVMEGSNSVLSKWSSSSSNNEILDFKPPSKIYGRKGQNWFCILQCVLWFETSSRLLTLACCKDANWSSSPDKLWDDSFLAASTISLVTVSRRWRPRLGIPLSKERILNVWQHWINWWNLGNVHWVVIWVKAQWQNSD